MFTIRKKLLISLALTIGLFTVSAGFVVWGFKSQQRLQNGNDVVASQVQNWLVLKYKLSQYLKFGMEDILSGSSVNKDQLAKAVDEIIHTFIVLEKRMRLKESYLTQAEWQEQKQQLLNVREQFGIINEELEITTGLFKKDLRGNARILANSNLIKKGMDTKFNELVDLALTREKDLSLRLTNDVERLRKNMLWIFGFIFTGSISLLLALISRINRSVQGSIQNAKMELLRGTEAVSSGNFDNEIKFSSQDELSVVAESFNKMAQDLSSSRTLVRQQQLTLISSAKMSSLGEMAGGVAHEINTPLAIITMRVEQLEESVIDGGIDPLEMVDILEVIKKTTDRIAKIVSGLRFFARDGKKDPVVKIAVAKIIDDTLSFCQERFSSHGIQLEVIKANSYEQIFLECRPVEISQVILNLLNNAYDAVQTLERKWICIEVADREQYVEICVTDSGQGIPKDLHDRIMQPFFTTKPIGSGTGLGLSLSKGIIESHHGKLVLDPHSPNTKFTILVPKVQPTDRSSAEVTL